MKHSSWSFVNPISVEAMKVFSLVALQYSVYYTDFQICPNQTSYFAIINVFLLLFSRLYFQSGVNSKPWGPLYCVFSPFDREPRNVGNFSKQNSVWFSRPNLILKAVQISELLRGL